MIVLVLVVLAGLVTLGVALDVLKDHRRREDWDRDRETSHARLMREIRRHG